MEKPKVSVIVPVYCAESYLKTCVDSLLCQTLKDIEIILVDDGSPDKSGELADSFAATDLRIRVIHQENAGPGAARNAGIRIAEGDYIGFVDSDDWVKPIMYQNLYQEAVRAKADIVVSGHCDVAEGKIMAAMPHPMAGTVLTSAKEIAKLRKKLYGVGLDDNTVDAFPMSACMSIYRREWMRQHELWFQNGLCEDTIFNLSAYRSAERISFISDVHYCYRKEEQPSRTHSFDGTKLEGYREFFLRLRNMANQEEDPDCKIRAQRTAIDSCRMYAGIVGNARISFIEKIAHVRNFAQDAQIRDCWKGYPVEALPAQQRIFHRMIERKQYAAALFLSWLRQWLKKGKRKTTWQHIKA